MKMTKEQVHEWGLKAKRGDICDFLLETVRKLDAIEGTQEFNEETEASANEGIRDAAEVLRAVLVEEFSTRV